MNWEYLLSPKRKGDKEKFTHNPLRSRFEQDYDRIIFSWPFRKMQDKTQVFPMPENDFVHTRLTHSLEVSSVGRSLGRNIGAHVLKKYPDVKNLGFSVTDFGSIVGAACLAHDFGNPPFGHSGEESISSFFQHSIVGQSFREFVSADEWCDLIQFEGNAQGFRILNNQYNNNINVTYATLGAYMKYPLAANAKKEKQRKSQKKYGFYQSSESFFEEVANEMKLLPFGKNAWSRHPLAFLTEAADDICYHIIDLEDGCRLDLVSLDEVKAFLSEIIGDAFSLKKFESLTSKDEKLSILRALSINQLIKECTDVFLAQEEEILRGDFDKALVDIIPSSNLLSKIIEVSVKKIYRSSSVVQKEIGGHKIIKSLLENFCPAAYASSKKEMTTEHRLLMHLMPEAFQAEIVKAKSVYEVLQLVLDFVSGMSDSNTIRLYKTVNGHV